MGQIDYRLRPGKHVERMMLTKMISRMASFAELKQFRYIGFGAEYFEDFKLFHRELGIRQMISIEENIPQKGRYKFNAPYNCVKLRFGTSRSVLPTLTWAKRTILWLDYSKKLDSPMLSDIESFMQNARSGSFFLITVNAAHSQTPSDTIRDLKSRLPTVLLPPTITTTSIAQWGLAAGYRQIINDKIEDVLNNRNAYLTPDKKLSYHQLVNFGYQDTSKMLTVGGVLHRESEKDKYTACLFDQLEFTKRSSNIFLIEVPLLTFKEINHLNSRLPLKGSSAATLPGVPSAEIDKFKRIYRYFPSFVSTEF